jgi:hypothetical protein
MLWAQADIGHATALMRHVFLNQNESLERARTGAEELRQKYAIEKVGQIGRDRLAMLQERL